MDKDNVLAVAHLDWRTLIKASDDTPADVVTALDAYFKPFAQPVHGEGEEGPMLCLECGEPLTGFFASMLGKGGFTWGLVHGEGYCRCCGWPGRAMHYVKDASGEELASIRNMVLQYHPDGVSKRKTKAS